MRVRAVSGSPVAPKAPVRRQRRASPVQKQARPERVERALGEREHDWQAARAFPLGSLSQHAAVTVVTDTGVVPAGTPPAWAATETVAGVQRRVTIEVAARRC